MIIFKLAYLNLMGAGLRTWLNVIVLSFSFVVIVWHKGLLDGWDRQAKKDMITWEMGGGQYWHQNYDPYDLFTIDDSHGKLSPQLQKAVEQGEVSPILISQGTIYPEGRIQNILIKGIDVNQKLIALPSSSLSGDGQEIQAIIGKRLAKNNKLKKGDVVTIRWRDANGTFDAGDMVIKDIFDSNVPSIDAGIVWLPLNKLQEMMQMPDEATILIKADNEIEPQSYDGWDFNSRKVLLSDFDKMIKSKSIGGSIFYIILLFLALLAVFDTQVLSIFRRQREIGTFIALGMTRGEVIRLFTLEGAMHSFLAAIVAAIYGIPLLWLQVKNGIAMPASSDDYGVAIADTIYPAYSLGLVVTTILVVLITTTIVSYMPAKKISKLKPTEAIRGKIQ